MMRLLTAAALGAMMVCTPSLAQEPASPGLSIPAMTAYLTEQGLTVGAQQQQGERRYVAVTDGPLQWVLFFQSCESDFCSDLQFSFAFADPAVSLEGTNRWNRERRFRKAFYEPATPPATAPAAAVQYDIYLNTAQGIEQLNEPLAIWRGSIPQFPAVATGAATPAP